MTSPSQQVLAKCKEVFAKAKEIYRVDCSDVAVRFDLKGRSAGQACRRGGNYYLRFNVDMLLRETEEIVNVVVPHEIAHIVCFKQPMLGNNHDSGWQRVDRALGGTGNRTHEMEVVYGKGTTYEYTTDRGHKVRINDRRHAHVQAGRTLMFRRGLGTVTKSCTYSIVGQRGHTFAAPIVKQVAETKEEPAATIVPVRTYTIGVPATPTPVQGQSKAAKSRAIMLEGHRSGSTYEQIINAMMLANGYSRQLARATYLANAAKVGIHV